MNRKKHIVVFLAYEDFDIIKKSFESIENIDSDIFVIENKSKNSEQIEDYFVNKSLKGYIQFNDNTENSCIPLFNNAYGDLVKQYDYITYTDGDLYAYDANDMFEEIIDAFKYSGTMVSTSEIWIGNYHLVEKDKSEIKPLHLRGTFEDYLEEVKNSNYEFGSKDSPIGLTTGHYFVTYKNADLEHIFKIPIYSDGSIYSTMMHLGRKWYKTTKNISYHMSWDSYYDGNPYYEWKKSMKKTLWREKKYSDFRIIK
jgi:hypothetical protein